MAAVLPSPPRLAAGFDFGTSGVRVALVEPASGAISSGAAAATRPLFTARVDLAPDAGADEWLGALETLLYTLPAELRARLTHIAVSGTSATCLVVERHPQAGSHTRAVLRPPRRYDFSVHSAAGGASALAAISRHAAPGHIASAPTSSLAKLAAWQVEAALPAAGAFCHQADFVAAALLEPEEPLTSDWHNALKLGFDVSHGALRYPDWLHALLADLGPAAAPLAIDALPRVVAPGAPIARVGAHAAARWGLPRACVVCAGTTDSIAAFLAATGGACSAGTAVSSLGSTIALKLLSDVRADDAALGLYSHRLGERWLVGGASNCGCAVLREHFSDAELTALSEAIDPERDDLDLAYVPLRAGARGERFPSPSVDAVQRLEPRPASRAEFLHAMLDALARVEARGYALLVERGANPPHTILSCGGGASNAQFTRIRSRLLSVAARLADTTEASVGVALLALSEGAIGAERPVRA